MLLEAVYHRPRLNWSYAYDRQTIHLRLRAKKGDLTEVFAWAGDKYAWDATKELIPMKLFTSDAMFDYWECESVPLYRRLKYGFLLQKGHERIWMTESDFQTERPANPNRLFEFPYINPVDVFAPPAWVKDAVFYQIFPERFANGDPSLNPENVQPWGGTPTPENFFGGDLQGVIDHLDHLTELGITGIYFTPIFAATTNHKYDTEDYMKVDPHFGDVKTLKNSSMPAMNAAFACCWTPCSIIRAEPLPHSLMCWRTVKTPATRTGSMSVNSRCKWWTTSRIMIPLPSNR